LGSEIKEDEVGIRDAQEFPHSGIGAIHAAKTTLKKGE
jgi:hypothetical protein